MKKRWFVVLVVLAALVSSGFMFACNSERLNSYEYQFESFSYLENEFNQSRNLNYDGYIATTDLARYSFAENITNKQRNKFITYSEQILEKLSVFYDNDGYMIVYVANDFYSRAERNPKDEFFPTVWFNYNDVKSINHIHYFLQALVGESTNYGFLYGLSARIYKDLGWGKIGAESEKQIKNFLADEDNRYILDLTYPVFNKAFSSTNRIKFAKSISLRVADYVDRNWEENVYNELLISAKEEDPEFNSKFYDYLNKWLHSLGVTQKEIYDISVNFSSYTSVFPFKAYTKSCIYVIHKDWQDYYLNELNWRHNIQSDYVCLTEYFMSLEKAFVDVKQFFECEEDLIVSIRLINGDTEIYGLTSDTKTTYATSLMWTTGNYSVICASRVLGDVSPEHFPIWELSSYCDNMFNTIMPNEFYYLINYRELDLTEERAEYFENLFGNVLDKYIELYGNLKDAKTFFYTYAYVHFFETRLDYYFYVDVAEICWLIDTYGKELYFDFFCSGNYIETYGKTASEMTDEFNEFIQGFISDTQ